METTIVAEYSNVETGCTGVVARISRGFSVVLRDDDSGIVFPEARVFPADAIVAAEAHAREIVGLPATTAPR